MSAIWKDAFDAVH